jgi:hypothetical protein
MSKLVLVIEEGPIKEGPAKTFVLAGSALPLLTRMFLRLLREGSEGV